MKENNIEEDIKILENMNDGYTFKDCNICNNYNEKTKHCDKHKCMELQAIEHILSDYKKILKENEELKRMLQNRIKYTQELEKDLFENCSNYVVPKQVIRDKIEELEKEVEEYLKTDNSGRFRRDNCRIVDEINILKELLGDE